jgi:hypothetical protein
MPNPVPAHYQDAGGVQHEVIVRKTPDGAWQVVDVSDGETRLVDEVTGIGEGEPAAEAIARDYTREQQVAGERTAPTH